MDCFQEKAGRIKNPNLRQIDRGDDFAVQATSQFDFLSYLPSVRHSSIKSLKD